MLHCSHRIQIPLHITLRSFAKSEMAATIQSERLPANHSGANETCKPLVSICRETLACAHSKYSTLPAPEYQCIKSAKLAVQNLLISEFRDFTHSAAYIFERVTTQRTMEPNFTIATPKLDFKPKQAILQLH
jgi:hypothetical protein